MAIAAHKFWIQEGISERRLAKFWKMTWHDSGDRKIMMCLWLIVHRGLPIGAWAKGLNVDRRCNVCGQLETIYSLSLGMSRGYDCMEKGITIALPCL